MTASALFYTAARTVRIVVPLIATYMVVFFSVTSSWTVFEFMILACAGALVFNLLDWITNGLEMLVISHQLAENLKVTLRQAVVFASFVMLVAHSALALIAYVLVSYIKTQ